MAAATIHITEAISADAIQTLETTLLGMNGVERALIDTNGGDIKIQYDDKIVSKENIMAALQQTGFSVQ